VSGLADWLLAAIFLIGAAVSLATSWVLVIRLERLGARLGLSEALLGMLAALAADAPEITAAVAALVRHDPRIGAGVVLGSNVFNLAALLGLTALVAGSIALHRRVIELNGAVALWICAASLAVVVGALSPLLGLLAVLVVFAPYGALLGLRPARLASLRLPATWTGWLTRAIGEEELELRDAIHPRRGDRRDALVAALAVATVVASSVAMERTASELGRHHAVPGIVTGALVLACVTSLPNAVSAVYLASRGRGAAVLSTALNSNALNVVAGLLLPAALLGLGRHSTQVTFTAGCYAAMTLLALVLTYGGRGLRRSSGAVIIVSYLAFVAVLLLMA
jgi:cation:H+ antiporter